MKDPSAVMLGWIMLTIVVSYTLGVATGYGFHWVEDWNARREAKMRGTATPESTRPYPYHVIEFPAATSSTSVVPLPARPMAETKR